MNEKPKIKFYMHWWAWVEIATVLWLLWFLFLQFGIVRIH